MYEQLIGAGVEAVTGSLGGIPYLVETDQDKYNEKRLKELQRKAEMDALGLTEEERQLYFQTLSKPAETARKALLEQQQLGAMAFTQGGAGEALKLGQLAREQQAQTESAIGAQILSEDLMTKDLERQELEDRLAYKAARDQQKAQVAMNFFMPILSSAGDVAQQQLTVSEPKKKKTIDGEELTPEAEGYLPEMDGFNTGTVPTGAK
jgi:hypothetical protein